MDFDDLQALAYKAREFTHTDGERIFTMRTPTLHEIRQVSHANGLRDFADGAERGMLQYHLVAQQCVAWTGVRLRDIVAGGASDPVACSAGAMRLLQDADPTLAEALGRDLLERVRLRNDAIEADAKNSRRTLPEAAAAATCES